MESLTEPLRSRNAFKFIVGINRVDWADLRFLTRIYSLAGADIIDVAGRPEACATARAAVAQARQQEATGSPGPAIMASLALPHDPHVEGSGVDPAHRSLIVPADARALAANARACLEQGADMVELHASDSDDDALREAVTALSAVLAGRYLSVCLGTEGLRSPRTAIRQAALVQAIHGPCTMIQAEGIVLAKDGTPASGLQGLALAQALLAHTGASILVAGGANAWTRSLALQLAIPIHGIASCTYARNLVEGFRDPGHASDDLETPVQLARRFIRRAKGVPEDAL